ncbi:tetrapyrrole biosynthesis, uroporphyrinogen III synthase [Microthyrium microscopicum]|uniref:Tetrapyrrole biosynthesis, uroporphyrinogen III synthase n=1 Tax=Microthyrium microscopicum TaxID=703497 RepID=A0A6A6TXG6_9PEZI|nr:tetrapyrrole biosynthesis, uroporphyrinogen III synthase [Microthyrium microscopicum]
MADDSKTRVILLKTVSKPTDRYEEVLGSIGYDPVFIPVLDHGLIDEAIDDIAGLILKGAFLSSFGGIIFTSQRAVEAFARVVEHLKQKHEEELIQNLRSGTTLYVVGPATHRALKALDPPCPIRGEETGTGEALAAYILENYKATDGQGRRRSLLFLVGEQRRDIIPRTLQSNDLPVDRLIGVHEITVYKTIENAMFRGLFDTELARSVHQSRWVVVFSPSGCKTMLESLGMLDDSTGKWNGQTHQSTKIATIGPTTRDYLVSEFGFTPDAVAKAPTPEGLRDAIHTT